MNGIIVYKCVRRVCVYEILCIYVYVCVSGPTESINRIIQLIHYNKALLQFIRERDKMSHSKANYFN